MAAVAEAQFVALARRLSFVLRVPGSHPRGLSYDELLAILAEQGRDFAADSKRLREHIAIAWREQFGGATRAPGQAQLKQFAAAAILEWIVARFETGLRDVPIKPNDSAYRAWKRRHAAYSVPGMSSGKLRDRVKNQGNVKVTL